jgi:hypothetical protein
VYAVCQDDECGTKTCVGCKKLLVGGKLQHKCSQADDEIEFKKTADEKGYQQCGVCGTTVELAEACNHITCDCGHSFCYICGEQWPGLHGCPHYGVPIYDAEGKHVLVELNIGSKLTYLQTTTRTATIAPPVSTARA